MKTLDQIQSERTPWANTNFIHGDRLHDLEENALGVLEEIGELVHWRLKKMQGIRDAEKLYTEQARDCVGDVCIYLLGVCDKSTEVGVRMVHVLDRCPPSPGITRDQTRLLHAAARLTGYLDVMPGSHRQQTAIADIWHFMATYCTVEGWSIIDVLNETWDKVSQRDWKKDPVSGGEQ